MHISGPSESPKQLPPARSKDMFKVQSHWDATLCHEPIDRRRRQAARVRGTFKAAEKAMGRLRAWNSGRVTQWTRRRLSVITTSGYRNVTKLPIATLA